MSKQTQFKPLSATVFVGAAVLIIATYVAMAFVGWFGMFLLGLLGMVITTRLELHDGIAVSDFDYGSTSVDMIARQKAERDRAGWQDQIDEKKRKSRQTRLIYILNTIWLAMITLGLGMFSLHQI
jgi:hypothetical protein